MSKETENQLKHLEELHDVIHVGFHQCNNYLATILTNCDLIQMMDENPQTAKRIESVKDKASAIATTLKAIYSFSRMGLELQFQPVKIKTLCEQALNTFSYAIEDLQIETSIVVPDVEVLISSSALEQILKIFIQNAIDSLASTNIRKVVIEIQITDGNFTLNVKDSGPVIDPEILEKLFKPFFTTKKTQLGLGLNNAKTLAKLMNGEVKFTRAEDQNCLSLIISKNR